MTSSIKKLTHFTDTRHMTDIQTTVDQYTINSWPIYPWQLTNIPPTYDRQSIKTCLRKNDRHSADSWSPYWLTINQLSTNYQPTVDRYISRLLTASQPMYQPMYQPTYQLRLPTVNMIRCISWVCIFEDMLLIVQDVLLIVLLIVQDSSGTKRRGCLLQLTWYRLLVTQTQD